MRGEEKEPTDYASVVTRKRIRRVVNTVKTVLDKKKKVTLKNDLNEFWHNLYRVGSTGVSRLGVADVPDKKENYTFLIVWSSCIMRPVRDEGGIGQLSHGPGRATVRESKAVG